MFNDYDALTIQMVKASFWLTIERTLIDAVFISCVQSPLSQQKRKKVIKQPADRIEYTMSKFSFSHNDIQRKHAHGILLNGDVVSPFNVDLIQFHRKTSSFRAVI